MASRWVYLALAIMFAFSCIQETLGRSLEGVDKKVESVDAVAVAPQALAGDYKERNRRSPKYKKFRKFGHGHSHGVVVVHHHHHGHHHHGHHHHGHHYHHF